MNKHDKNFLINFSPLLMAAVVMFLMLVAIETKAEDKIIGYTSDGIPVLESEIPGVKDLMVVEAPQEVEAPKLVSIPYTVVDNEVIVAFGYGIRLIATYPCNVTPGDIVVPEPGLTEIGISTKFLVQRTLPDGKTMNYLCRVVGLEPVANIDILEEKNDKED